jgi:hypothetical protein
VLESVAIWVRTLRIERPNRHGDFRVLESVATWVRGIFVIEPARGAVEQALAAGATDAEAYASEDAGREIRAHGGEIESLTAATQRGIGVRAWIGHQVGYAFGTDLS